MTDELSPAVARRIALAAQGFGRPAPTTVGTRALHGVIDRLRMLQIDSVNVFDRSHYLPAFARVGAYDRSTLDALTMRPRARYLEYWAHQAAFIPASDLPLFGFRMQFYRAKYAAWIAEHETTVQLLLDEIADRGPLVAGEIAAQPNVREGPWWGWSDAKTALELLWLQGDLVTNGRRGFERRYGLPDQVLASGMPEFVAAADAVRELVRRAAVAYGIGTLSDFADYYRLRTDETRSAVRELEDAGELVPVTVRGWMRGGRPLPTWRHVDARAPRWVRGAALLSPFDPLVWQRDRAERLFGFRYRISIYTPAAQREHGYYVLPALVDEALVGRVDLKSDRQAGLMRVQAAWAEPDAPSEAAERLAPVIASAAEWQGLTGVEVTGRGDLAASLQGELAALQRPQ